VKRLGEVCLGTSSWTSTEVVLQDGLVAAAAGNIGNRSELAKRLGLPADVSPGELLIALWQEVDEKTPSWLRGEFAAAVSDGSNLWSFRDHFGFGTLFYRLDGRRVVIASEAKQAAAAAATPRRPDLEKLEALFWGRSEDGEPPCVIEGIDRVPRATLVWWGRDGSGQRRYWDPSHLVDTARMKPVEARERTLQLLRQSIRRALMGRVAVSLSGGIDSSTIAAIAAPIHLEMTGRPLLTISNIYPHAPSVDEASYIDRTVDYLGVEAHSFVPGYKRLQDVQSWVDILDGPGSPAAYAALAEFLGVARDLGADTVLMGDLAEYIYDVRDHVLGHLIATGHWRTASRHWSGLRRSGMRSASSLLRETMVSLLPSPLAGVYRRVRKTPVSPRVGWAFDPERMPALERRVDLDRPVLDRWRSMQTWYASGPSSHSIEAFSICAEYCRMSVIRPLNDVDLTEFLISLPAHLKFPDSRSKSLIRETMRGLLPDEIVDRPKKTSFNEDTLARVDYSELRRWLLGGEYRMPGVDYEQLARHLEDEQMDFWELRVAHNLADYHAFVSLWE
jgi:asparagine synthase (glutamine-hydrolysing)